MKTSLKKYKFNIQRYKIFQIETVFAGNGLSMIRKGMSKYVLKCFFFIGQVVMGNHTLADTH